jgi:hypothetical protein
MRDFLWWLAALYSFLAAMAMLVVVVGGIGYGIANDWRFVVAGIMAVPIGLLFGMLASYCVRRT